MKKNLALVIVTGLVIFLTNACKKDGVTDPPVIPPISDNSLPSGAVSNVKLTNKSAGSLEFTIDITVFRDSKNVETQLKAENFTMDTLAISSTRYYFNRLQVNASPGSSSTAYSALMLMDQSGSILSTDPRDHRIEAAKAFCRNLGPGDNVMLWSFAGNTQQKYGVSFTSDSNLVIPDIESLHGKEGGATPLYKSQYAATNFAASNAPAANKALMTFTDGDDTEAGYTSQQVTDNAINKNVKLFNVGLGNAHIQTLSTQSAATGGAFMFAQDARQLISMFGNLGKLLNGTAQYYRASWKITRSTGNFTSGTLLHKVRISLPYNLEVSVPFSIAY